MRLCGNLIPYRVVSNSWYELEILIADTVALIYYMGINNALYHKYRKRHKSNVY